MPFSVPRRSGFERSPARAATVRAGGLLGLQPVCIRGLFPTRASPSASGGRAAHLHQGLGSAEEVLEGGDEGLPVQLVDAAPPVTLDADDAHLVQRLQVARDDRAVLRQVGGDGSDVRGAMALPAAAAVAVEEDTGGRQGGEKGRAGSRAARLDWAGLLKRTFAQEVLTCVRCGGRRRVVAYLTHSPAVRQVLLHLKLSAHVPPLAIARGPPPPDFWQ